MKTSGRDRNQKTTKPVNSAVVVGISDPNEFGILLYEGQSAVRQMLEARSISKSIIEQSPTRTVSAVA